MKTTKTNETTEQWKIDGEYITDMDGSPRFRVMGTAPYNQAWMEKAVQAVNERAALLEVEKALRFIQSQLDPKFDGTVRQHVLYSDCLSPESDDETVVEYLREALAKLAAIRGGGQ